LEGPLAKQTDVSKALARGITKGTFMGASRTKAVTRGWAHWSADQCNPPPTFSFGEKVPGGFPMAVQDPSSAAAGEPPL